MTNCQHVIFRNSFFNIEVEMDMFLHRLKNIVQYRYFTISFFGFVRSHITPLADYFKRWRKRERIGTIKFMCRFKGIRILVLFHVNNECFHRLCSEYQSVYYYNRSRIAGNVTKHFLNDLQRFYSLST